VNRNRGPAKIAALMSVGIGVGLAILTSALSGISWYTSRQWDSTALRATLDHVALGPHNQLHFYYDLENRTSSSYEVSQTSPVELMVKFRQESWLSPDYRSLRLTEPFSVPARQHALIVIPFCKASGLVIAGRPNSGSADGQIARMISLVKAACPNLKGFVLYDRKKRYQIVFPGIDNGTT